MDADYQTLTHEDGVFRLVNGRFGPSSFGSLVTLPRCATNLPQYRGVVQIVDARQT